MSAQHWPDGEPVTPWADPWHDVLGDVQGILEGPDTGNPLLDAETRKLRSFWDAE